MANNWKKKTIWCAFIFKWFGGSNDSDWSSFLRFFTSTIFCIIQQGCSVVTASGFRRCCSFMTQSIAYDPRTSTMKGLFWGQSWTSREVLKSKFYKFSHINCIHPCCMIHKMMDVRKGWTELQSCSVLWLIQWKYVNKTREFNITFNK